MAPPTNETTERQQRRRRIVFKEDLEREWGIRANDATLWRWEKQGKFPKHFPYGNKNAWYDDVIDAHVNSLGEAV
jgi:predicted DNA-binding transcriptional regulator AlpA